MKTNISVERFQYKDSPIKFTDKMDGIVFHANGNIFVKTDKFTVTDYKELQEYNTLVISNKVKKERQNGNIYYIHPKDLWKLCYTQYDIIIIGNSEEYFSSIEHMKDRLVIDTIMNLISSARLNIIVSEYLTLLSVQFVHNLTPEKDCYLFIREQYDILPSKIYQYLDYNMFINGTKDLPSTQVFCIDYSDDYRKDITNIKSALVKADVHLYLEQKQKTVVDITLESCVSRCALIDKNTHITKEVYDTHWVDFAYGCIRDGYTSPVGQLLLYCQYIRYASNYCHASKIISLLKNICTINVIGIPKSMPKEYIPRETPSTIMEDEYGILVDDIIDQKVKNRMQNENECLQVLYSRRVAEIGKESTKEELMFVSLYQNVTDKTEDKTEFCIDMLQHMNIKPVEIFDTHTQRIIDIPSAAMYLQNNVGRLCKLFNYRNQSKTADITERTEKAQMEIINLVLYQCLCIKIVKANSRSIKRRFVDLCECSTH